MRKKKKNEKEKLTASHTKPRAPPELTPISTIGNEWGNEKKKRASISEVRKAGKS